MNQFSVVSLSDETVVVSIFGERPPLLPILFLSVFVLGGMMMPILILFLVDEFSFGLFVSMGIFLGVSIFLLRILLWNLFGKQVLEFHLDNIKHYFDYKLFHDQKLQGTAADFYFSKTSRGEEDGKLQIVYLNKNIISPFQLDGISLDELISLIQELSKPDSGHH
ncbi:MAG: hypothetical protein IPM74_11135 [Crocinitomicaceae bacterium]|nr:hypothetical protein [Crocinitomicaceae bacterium]MBK8926436.1 hypothetical protein [Crocinitomicaceae bacterium]